MKVGISQKVLLDVLTRGGIPALSEDAQGDTSTLSLLIKSVQITADENFTVESNTELLAIKCSIPIDGKGGHENIKVEEGGSVLVPAKQLFDWVKLQNEDSIISMIFKKLDKPEIISTIDATGEPNEYDDKYIMKIIGTLKLASKKPDGTLASITKWEIDCFDCEAKGSIDYDEKSEKVFKITGKAFIDGLEQVEFACSDQDYEHLFDSISIQKYNDNLYMAATNKGNCALCKVADVEIFRDKPLLLLSVLANRICKAVNKEDLIIVSHDDIGGKIYIQQKHIKIRVNSLESRNVEGFPQVQYLFKKTYDLLVQCPKEILMGALANANIVNPNSALFRFNKKENKLSIQAKSEDAKLKPLVKTCELGEIKVDVTGIFGVLNLIKALKAIKSDRVNLFIPENQHSLKIIPVDNDNLTIFTAAIENKIYS